MGCRAWCVLRETGAERRPLMSWSLAMAVLTLLVRVTSHCSAPECWGRLVCTGLGRLLTSPCGKNRWPLEVSVCEQEPREGKLGSSENPGLECPSLRPPRPAFCVRLTCRSVLSLLSPEPGAKILHPWWASLLSLGPLFPDTRFYLSLYGFVVVVSVFTLIFSSAPLPGLS